MKKYIDPFDSKTEEYARKFDQYYDEKNVNATKELINDIEQQLEDFDELSKARLGYSLGTAYSDIMLVEKYNEDIEKKSIYYYNYAINILEKTELREENKPYIYPVMMNAYVNYGNALENIGRISSSIEYYKKALKINKENKMALGNLSISYIEYAMLLYDHGHRDFFNKAAYDGLKKLFELSFSKEDLINKSAILKFEGYLKSFSEEYIQYLNTRKYDLEITEYEEEELKYRQWASKNNLFLNPLNDLYHDIRIAYDIIHLPNMFVEIGEKPIYHGMYNQFKEEYIYLRYLFYEATQSNRVTHYADRDNLLLELYDLPLYSIRLEKLKTVFRQLYSMFDKIAYFINSYYELGIPERKVSFKNIWNEKLTVKNKLNIEDNFMLKTLYWTSKEIYSNDSFSTNSLAEEIDVIRNHLEHKYVKIYFDGYEIDSIEKDDPLAKYIAEEKIENMTMYLMKLIREIIINLSLMVNIEENKKDKNVKTMKIKFDICRDEWKM